MQSKILIFSLIFLVTPVFCWGELEIISVEKKTADTHQKNTQEVEPSQLAQSNNDEHALSSQSKKEETPDFMEINISDDESEQNKISEPDKTQKAERDLAAQKIKKTSLKRFKKFAPKSSNLPKFRKKTPLPFNEIKPPSSSKLHYPSGTDEAELESTINEEISYLFKMLKRNPSSEILLRLGSIYVDKARLITLKLQLDYERKFKAYEQKTRKTKPVLNLRTAESYNKKALKLFKNLKQRYPKHKRMDEILFFLGFNSYQLSQESDGEKYFKELEQRFPKSEYLYEVWFQLGEHYFKKRQWKSSFKYYNKVAKNKNGKFYFFAVYKMAWADYKLSRINRGLKLLERIIRESKAAKTRAQKQRLSFASEATQDLILFYTYSSRPPETAKSYFLSFLDSEVAWRSLKKLAYAYRDTGNSKGVRVLFSDLIQYNPLDKQAFDYKYQIIHSTYETGSMSQILKEFNEWIVGYGAKSSWAKANANKKNLVKKAATLIETTLRNYALKNHQTFRISKNKKELTIALNLYRLYFSEFKKSPHSNQIFFFYGELLFDSRQYTKAITAYELVIKRYPNSKYAKPAYINQLLAVEKQLPTIAQIERLIGKSDQPHDLPDALKKFAQVAKRYINKFPNEKNTPTVIYRLGVFYYKFNQFDQAGKSLSNLLAKYPQSEFTSSAGSLLLDIYNKDKNYASLEKLANQFTQNKKIDKELLAEARFVLEQISFKKAQDLAINKKYKESADLYRKFAKSYPKANLSAKAYYNAGINYEKHKDIKSAVSMYAAVLKYPFKSNQSINQKSLEFLPVLQEKLGFYKQAANAYARYAKRFPSSSKAADYWYNSGVIFDALNMVASATFSYGKYYQINKTQERHEALYLIASLYERVRNWKQALYYYNQYLNSASNNRFNLVKSSFKVAKIYENKIRNQQKADAWYRKTLSLYRRLKAGVSYGARSHFHQIYKVDYKNFLRVKIPKQSKLQKAAVAKKISLLNSLETKLRPVIRYNDGGPIIASLALTGLSNQKMAEAIYNTPIPKGLDAKGKKQYREGIKNLIQPYIKKSINSYNLALKKSESFKVYSEWIKIVHKGLATIVLDESNKFNRFNYFYVAPETLKLTVLDNKGTITKGFLKTVNNSLKYNVSKQDLIAIEAAIKDREESKVLQAVSNVLNKDPDNVLAINSLSFFYLKNKKVKLGSLIMNRVLSKKDATQAVLLNNLAVITLKYGQNREAFSYFKEALSIDGSYAIAKMNLANLYLKNLDYANAYPLYRDTQNKVFKRDSSQNEKFLNNYGVALAGLKKWKTSYSLMKSLSSQSSPNSSVLLNYAIVLTTGFKDNKSFQNEAKGLVSEIELYSKSVIFKKKLDRLSKSIQENLKP